MVKKTYTALVVLILIVLGAVFFIGRGSKVEAPVNGGNMAKIPAVAIPADYNAPLPTTSAPVKEFTVTGQNFSFTPSTLAVNKGDVVKITFKNAAGFHDFRIDDYKVATHQIKTGAEETVSFIADRVGTFQYFCSVGSHRSMGMWGTLTVK